MAIKETIPKIEADIEDVFSNALVAAWKMSSKQTAERCIEIVSEVISTPKGKRRRDWSEVVHAIMREMLEQGGM